MKENTKETLRENIYKPANLFMQTLREKPASPIAAMVTFGVGLGLLLASNSKYRSIGRAGNEPARQNPQFSSPKSDYFEAAPRSVTGSHPSYRLQGDIGNGRTMKISGQFLIGSAALVSILYLLGKKGAIRTDH